MNTSQIKNLRVSAIQVGSTPFEKDKNLTNTLALIKKAKDDGSELILLPELLPNGYIYDKRITNSAEEINGAIEKWLKTQGKKFKVFIGTSFLQKANKKVLNTFTLVGPDGKVRGRVSKKSTPFYESFFIDNGDTSRSIDTEIGKIGIGICFDNHTNSFLKEMIKSQVDLLLMPYCAPHVETPLLNKRIKSLINNEPDVIPNKISKLLNTPAIFCNQFSHQITTSPMPLVPFSNLNFRFKGNSRIINENGVTIKKAKQEECVITETIKLSFQKKKMHTSIPKGYWSTEVDKPTQKILAPAILNSMDKIGYLHKKFNQIK